MGFLLIIVLLALSSWMLIALFRRLWLEHVSTRWWVTFGFLFVCGVALGIWCAFHCEYHVGARFRVASFPIPVVFFHLEDDNWVDFPVPKFQAWSAAFTNVITIAALTMLPLWLLSRWRHGPDRR